MDKNGTTQTKIVFVREFTQAAQEYLKTPNPTIKGFADSLNVDEQTIWGWATKHTKDENGKVTEQLARPHFFEAIQAIKKMEDAKSREEQEPKLNPKQELFCRLYATSKEHFGNATTSYIVAYGIDVEQKNAYEGARASASNLLTNLNILQRVDELLGDLTDEVVDQELSFIVRQRFDLPSKLGGIREYNKLKTRILTKIDHTTNGKDLPTPIYAGKSE